MNSRDGKNHPFRYIGGVVADPFEVLGNQHQIEGAFGELFVLSDAVEESVFGAVEQTVHFVVRLADLFGEVQIRYS